MTESRFGREGVWNLVNGILGEIWVSDNKMLLNINPSCCSKLVEV